VAQTTNRLITTKSGPPPVAHSPFTSTCIIPRTTPSSNPPPRDSSKPSDLTAMRKPKPPKPSSAQLAAVLDDFNRYHRVEAFYAYSRYRPDVADLPTLRRALRDPESRVGDWAIVSIGKLGPQASDAVEDLIAAATAPWEHGTPLYFESAIVALLKIVPDDPRLIGIIQPVLSHSNYGIFKTAVQALVSIGTTGAWETIRWIDRYWGTARKDRVADEFIHKTLHPGQLEPRDTAPIFIPHQDALFRKHQAGYRTSVYCPGCQGPMTSLKGTVPYQCRVCSIKLSFSAQELEAVMSRLP
jgi:hypothetical protein